MMLPYLLTTRAERDLAAARLWYENISANLAERFIEDAYATIRIVREHPSRFPKFDDRTHATRCSAFPYRILYEFDQQRLLIKAIYHTARNPQRWDDSTRD